MTFVELYNKILEESIKTGKTPKIRPEYDKKHIDCLLNPEEYSAVVKVGKCECEEEKKDECIAACIFGAITKDENGEIIIDKEKCTGCTACIDHCKKII